MTRFHETRLFKTFSKFPFCSVLPSSGICQFLPCHHLSLILMSGLHLESASILTLTWWSHRSRSRGCFPAKGSLRFKLHLFYKLLTSLHSPFLMHSVGIVVPSMIAALKSNKLLVTCHCSFSRLHPSAPPCTSRPDYWLMITWGTLKQWGPFMLVKPSSQSPICGL